MQMLNVNASLPQADLAGLATTVAMLAGAHCHWLSIAKTYTIFLVSPNAAMRPYTNLSCRSVYRATADTVQIEAADSYNSEYVLALYLNSTCVLVKSYPPFKLWVLF